LGLKPVSGARLFIVKIRLVIAITVSGYLATRKPIPVLFYAKNLCFLLLYFSPNIMQTLHSYVFAILANKLRFCVRNCIAFPLVFLDAKTTQTILTLLL